eukprot:SAG11_NODE_6718_length_1260_cov_6.960379_1_plen_54_part_10
MLPIQIGVRMLPIVDSLDRRQSAHHLRQTIKKESGYYTLSIEQMLEIAKGEEDA